MPPPPDRFEGTICGVGATSGVRIVIGHWASSPLGAFTDVMVEDRDGRRSLLAPDSRVAEYVTSVYSFDDVIVEPLEGVVSRASWPQRLLFTAVAARGAEEPASAVID